MRIAECFHSIRGSIDLFLKTMIRTRRFEIVLYTHMYTRIHIYLSISLIESKVERVLFRYDHQRNFSTMDTYMCIKYTFEEERVLFLFPTVSMNIYWTGESAKFAS